MLHAQSVYPAGTTRARACRLGVVGSCMVKNTSSRSRNETVAGSYTTPTTSAWPVPLPHTCVQQPWASITEAMRAVPMELD
jgi:hypothetical protein